jgi:hypothetical protein
MKCLLVKPDYKVKYPNLALCKLSTKLKNYGNQVEYVKGMKPMTLSNLNEHYDEIYITTLFTYHSEICINTINFYKNRYKDAKIFVGGIFASLMPDLIRERTGITSFIGYSKELDSLIPDYSLIKTGTKWDDFSFVFTSRGCVNRCPFCAVHRIEPERWINPNWKNGIDFSRKNVMISDNNLTSTSINHFRDVCDFLREHKLGVIFDNGFDCRLFTKEHLEALQGVKILNGGLRFAFDGMQSDQHIQKTLQLCLNGGISKGKLMVYVLFNFMDTPKEAEYRMREIVKFGARPYPQQYTPLNTLNRDNPYIGKYWTKELTKTFRYFYLMAGFYIKQTFPEWLSVNREYLLNNFNYQSVKTEKENINKAEQPTIEQPTIPQ